MISVLIDELAKTSVDSIENTTAHKLFLKKFRKRANVAPERE